MQKSTTEKAGRRMQENIGQCFSTLPMPQSLNTGPQVTYFPCLLSVLSGSLFTVVCLLCVCVCARAGVCVRLHMYMICLSLTKYFVLYLHKKHNMGKE